MSNKVAFTQAYGCQVANLGNYKSEQQGLGASNTPDIGEQLVRSSQPGLGRRMVGCSSVEDSRAFILSIEQWFPTLGGQMFLDYSSQKSWPAQLVVKASGSFNPRTSGHPRLEAVSIERWKRLQSRDIFVCT